MSLINCPECGHEVSSSAPVCPNCGRPFLRPVSHPETVVTAVPTSSDRFPTWVFIPLGILGVVLLIVFFALMNRNNDETANSVNVNISAKRAAADSRSTGRTESQTVTVPPASDTQTITVPPSQTTTTISNPPAGKGAAELSARIDLGTGAPQAVRNEKFYLLDKDLESILSDADLEPINGQSLMNSFGLSVLFPDRYGDFNRDALNAIKGHIRYSTLTDGSGKAQMSGIDPDVYYLFGVTKTGKGFAVWSSPVTISGGQNILNLSPQRLTEIQE
jgi:hypothetical protein